MFFVGLNVFRDSGRLIPTNGNSPTRLSLEDRSIFSRTFTVAVRHNPTKLAAVASPANKAKGHPPRSEKRSRS